MLGLGNLVSPEIGLGMLRKEIEKTLGFPVQSYTMLYDLVNSKMNFIIPVNNEKRNYPFDNPGAVESLGKLFMAVCSEKIPKNTTIEKIVVSYGDNCTATVAYKNESGNSEQMTIEL